MPYIQRLWLVFRVVICYIIISKTHGINLATFFICYKIMDFFVLFGNIWKWLPQRLAIASKMIELCFFLVKNVYVKPLDNVFSDSAYNPRM